jgi:hypothetical protein
MTYNLITQLNKWIIGFKPIKGSSLHYWYRLMVHNDYRFDDRHLYADFWYHLNYGWWSMEYDSFITSPKADEAAMGINPCEDIPDEIVLSEEDYGAIREAVENPPPPSPFLRQLLGRPSPWE